MSKVQLLEDPSEKPHNNENLESKLLIQAQDETKEGPGNQEPDSEIQKYIKKGQKLAEEYREMKKQDQKKAGYFELIFKYADKTEKFLISLAFICAALVGMLNPLNAIFMGIVVDQYSPSSTSNIQFIAVLMFIIALLIFGFAACYYSVLEFVSLNIQRKIRVQYFESVLRKEVQWFDERNSTELQTKMASECQTIERMSGRLMGVQIQISFQIVFAAGYAYATSALYTSLLLIYFPVFLIFLRLLRVASQKGLLETMRSQAQSAGYAEQAFNSIKVVCAFGQEQTELTTYNRFCEIARKKGEEAVLAQSFSYASFIFALGIFSIYSFSIASVLMLRNSTNFNTGQGFTGGELIACYNALFTGFYGLSYFLPNLKVIMEGRIAGYIVNEVIEQEKESSQSVRKQPNVLQGKIEFQQVSFSYKNQHILSNFSATFAPGKVTAIVGKSGSGKSTIVNLIEKFYRVDGGTILVDDVDISRLDVKEYRNMVGYVGQEPVMLNSSIKENMRYACPDASESQIVDALKMANIYEFIEGALSEGIETNVGNAGTQLSGGQKQRIAIARAFLKKPRILLLDEATSSLDQKNEREVQEAIEKIRMRLGTVTTVVVAHRLSTIQNADHILVLDKGEIVQQGKHEELLLEGGLYAQLLGKQHTDDFDSWDSRRFLSSASQHQPPSRKVSTISSTNTSFVFRQEHPDLSGLEQQRPAPPSLYQKGHRLLSLSSTRFVVVGLISAIGIGLYYPVLAWNTSQMIFALQSGYPDQQLLIRLLFIFVLLLLYQFTLQILLKRSFGKIGQQVSERLRVLLYKSILRKHMGWFDIRDNSPSILSTVMAKDATLINKVSSEGLAIIAESSSNLVLSLILAFAMAWQVALVALVTAPFYIVTLSGIQVLQARSAKEIEESQKQANLLSGDAIFNYKTVASFANNEKIISQYDNFLYKSYHNQYKSKVLIGLIYGLHRFSLLATNAAIFFVAAKVLENSPSTPPVNLYAAQLIITWAIYSFANTSTFVQDLGQASASAERIFSIIDSKSEIDPMGGQVSIPEKKEITEIEFINVWFRYPSRPDRWILSNFNLVIRGKESVVLVGESGCGKSTVVQLLLRFYDVSDGVVLVNGRDVRSYPLEELRGMFGLVMQEPALFNYTVYENVLYGNLEAKNSEILRAVEEANAMEFVQGFAEAVDDIQCEDVLKAIESNESEFKQILGSKSLSILKKDLQTILEGQPKGTFQSIKGVIDYRSEAQSDTPLSKGFYKQCGIKGSRLSGGQKQRIAIARALVRNPKVLILDEATSSLDEEAQRVVQRSINQIMKERTTLVVAHRLSTISSCDRVVVLKEGEVVEEGTFQGLSRHPSTFFSNLLA